MAAPRLSGGILEGMQELEMLGSTKIPQHAQLLQSSMNPAMDVALLFTTPPSGSAAAAAASAGNAALPAAAPVSLAHARMREMMLRRQQQAAAARAGAGAGAAGAKKGAEDKVPEPTRGQPIKASLWRMGDESTMVWEVNLPRPDVFLPLVNVSETENEDCAVVEMVWSPDGELMNILLVSTDR